MTDEKDKDELEVFFDGEEHDEISTDKPVEEPAKVETETEPEKATETEPETTTEEKPTLVPIAALHDERRKAQQLKGEVEALRSQLPQPDEAPDPYEDINKYNAYLRGQWEKEQFEKQEQKRIEFLGQSRSKMLESHQDYDENEKIFELLTVRDRSLVDKMYASGNPAKFAYDTAVEYKNSVLKPAEIEPETEEPPTKEVPNLAKATASAPNTPQVEQEATIEDVFADQTY